MIAPAESATSVSSSAPGFLNKPSISVTSSLSTVETLSSCSSCESLSLFDVEIPIPTSIGGQDDHHQKRPISILVVPSYQDSISEDICNVLHHAARQRKRQRLQKKGLNVAFEDVGNHKVKFSEVTVRKYPLILGDNPGGAGDGPPVTIDWIHFDEQSFNSVEEFEEIRDFRHGVRGHGLELLMTAEEKVGILQRAGTTREEMEAQMRRSLLARNQRIYTMYSQASVFDEVEEIYETMFRKMKAVLSLGFNKRKERKLLKPYKQASKKQSQQEVMVRA